MGLPLLQLPKTKEFFKGLGAPKGYKLVYADASALEPHVCAFYSRDPGMLSLYKKGAPANDIYTFFAHSTDQYGQLTRSCGYDPASPTKEAIKAFKSKYSQERQVSKKIILGCIAKGTLVRVKDLGHIPIENVTKGMLVWDGSMWVSTSGAISKGMKPCIKFNEHWMTYDHKIKTKSGWDMASRTTVEQAVRPDEPGYSWADVWSLVRTIFRGKDNKYL